MFLLLLWVLLAELLELFPVSLGFALLLAEPLELLLVPLVFSAFLSQLPCNPLEFFLQLRVRLAELLELLPVSLGFALLLAEPLELLLVPLVFSAFLSQLPCNLLEFFLQLRVRLAELLELFPVSLGFALLLSEPLELLLVPLVFSAFLSQLPCNPLKFFLQLRVHLAELLELLPVSLGFALLLAEPIELLLVPLVFSAFLSQLPCNLLEFFLQLRVPLAELLELLPVSLDFTLLLA